MLHLSRIQIRTLFFINKDKQTCIRKYQRNGRQQQHTGKIYGKIRRAVQAWRLKMQADCQRRGVLWADDVN